MEEVAAVTHLFNSLLERSMNIKRTTRTSSTMAPAAPTSPYTRLFLVLNSQVSPLYHSVSVVRQLRQTEEADRERERSESGAANTHSLPASDPALTPWVLNEERVRTTLLGCRMRNPEGMGRGKVQLPRHGPKKDPILSPVILGFAAQDLERLAHLWRCPGLYPGT